MQNSDQVKKVVNSYLKELTLYILRDAYMDIFRGDQYIAAVKFSPPSTSYKNIILINDEVVMLFLNLFGVKSKNNDFKLGMKNVYYLQKTIKDIIIDKVNEYYCKPNNITLMTDDNTSLSGQQSSSYKLVDDDYDFKINLY